jgi:hypothetical protein
MHLANERQCKGFTAETLTENIKMHQVFEKMGWRIKAKRLGGVDRRTMEFSSPV